MNAYAKAAVLAAHIYVYDRLSDPTVAWNEAVRTVFPSSRSLQQKGCPKGAFLGLCAAGSVRGVSGNSSANSGLNAQYATEALELLKHSRELGETADAKTLWKLVMQGTTKVHNHQMDVVLGLWRGGLLRYP